MASPVAGRDTLAIESESSDSIDRADDRPKPDAPGSGVSPCHRSGCECAWPARHEGRHQRAFLCSGEVTDEQREGVANDGVAGNGTTGCACRRWLSRPPRPNFKVIHGNAEWLSPTRVSAVRVKIFSRFHENWPIRFSRLITPRCAPPVRDHHGPSLSLSKSVFRTVQFHFRE